jgi:hypothetical protein
MKAAGLLDGKPAIARLTHLERMQQKQTSVSITDVRSAALEAFRSADSGAAFHAALKDKGLHLALGKSQVLIVDQSGAHHGLNRVLRAAAKDAGQPPISAADNRAMLSGIELPPLAAVQADVRGAQPDNSEAGKHGNTQTRAPSGPSIGHGGGASAGASSDGPDMVVDLASGDEMAAAKALKRAADAMKRQLRASASTSKAGGGQEAVIAAQRLAAAFSRSITSFIREGERYARREERRALRKAAKLAAEGRYADALELFDTAWQSLTENLVDERPVGDPSGDGRAADGHDPHPRPAGPAPDRLRGDRRGPDNEQPVAAPVTVGAAGGTVSEPADPRGAGTHRDRAGRDLGPAILDRVEASQRDIELGRRDAAQRLERLVVQSALIARQQQNPATPEPVETAHQRLQREFGEYREQHQQREKERWSTAFSRRREIAGFARDLLQRGDGRLAPDAARQLRAATMASNTKLRDVLQKTKPPLDTYAAFVSRKAELGDPAAQQVHKFIVKREQQKQALLREVDRVRDDRLSVLSSDPWPDDRSRNAKLLADDARRALEKPRAVALKKVAELDAVADHAEALIGPADRLARSLGISTDRVRAVEAARHQADVARAKLEPAETYEFRLKAAKANAMDTAQKRQAERDNWRDKDVTTAERELEIAHRIDTALNMNDREICRCSTYQGAVRIIEERLKKEREDRRRQQLEQQRNLEQQQEQNTPAAGPSLGPRMR